MKQAGLGRKCSIAKNEWCSEIKKSLEHLENYWIFSAGVLKYLGLAILYVPRKIRGGQLYMSSDHRPCHSCKTFPHNAFYKKLQISKSFSSIKLNT